MPAENEKYRSLYQALQGLVQDETDALANLSNGAALLFHGLERVSWAGFYLFKEHQLVLGPFQGKPACVRIALGKGVCGTAARTGRSVVVEDVHRFPGHIACDAASASEIVLPILVDGELVGVLDLDSPVRGRFTEEDRRGLQSCLDLLSAHVRWGDLLR